MMIAVLARALVTHANKDALSTYSFCTESILSEGSR